MGGASLRHKNHKGFLRAAVFIDTAIRLVNAHLTEDGEIPTLQTLFPLAFPICGVLKVPESTFEGFTINNMHH